MNGLLGNMTHADLMRMREQPGADQRMLAPYEHRAFAREATQENPLMAISLVAGIPLYQLVKMLGLHGSRSGVDLEQVRQGYVGVGEGLRSGLLGK
jgi:hypothetical protein